MITPPRNEKAIAVLSKVFMERSRDEWLDILQAADIPCAPVNHTEESINDPQAIANEMVEEVEEPHLGKVREMGVPNKLSRTPGRIRGRSPMLGEHTEDVLAELGYSAGDIARLKGKRVV